MNPPDTQEVTQVNTAPPPASATEALGMLHAAMGFLNAADAGGRCRQPASACEVHHVRHKANGGKTSTKDCVLLCFFHHQVVIHRWGWTLVLNPDGTTTAWNPDKTKDLAKLGRVRSSET